MTNSIAAHKNFVKALACFATTAICFPVVLAPQAARATTVGYTIQTGNFNQLQLASGTGGWWDNTGTEIGMWANGNSGNNGAAAFHTLTINGVGSGTARKLQIGDEFTITLYTANNTYSDGYFGIAYNDSTTYGSYSDLSTGSRGKIEIGGSGNFKAINGGATVDLGVGAGSDRTIIFKPTSSKTFNVNINSTWYYDIPMANSPGVNSRIQSFCVYVHQDNGNKYIKNGSLSDTGGIAIGGGNGSSTFDGLIADGLAANSTSTTTANSLYKIGTGIITLTYPNTYSGITEIQNGTLQVSDDNNLGTAPGSPTAGKLSIWSTGTLKATNNFSLSSNRGISLGDVAGDTIAVASGKTLTYGGIMTGASDWNKSEAGTLVLTSTAGANTGKVTIQAGTLQINNDRALGAVPGTAAEKINIWSAGTFEANGTFALNSNRQIALGALAGPKISVTTGNTLSYGGQISGSANWSKEGAGTLVLQGSNPYSGATAVNGGTLLVNGSTAAGSAVSVASGATLGGSGIISGAVTVASGGRLAPGASIGILTLNGGVTFNSSSTYTVEVSGATCDLIDLGTTGALTVNSSAVLTIETNNLVNGNTYVVARRVNGNITPFTLSPTLPSGWFIHYVTNNPNSYIILNQSPTAVVLTGFRVATVDGKVNVIWTTSSENGTFGFDVQRLIDGQWVTIGHVDAKGPGSTYSVVDANAVLGQTYSYRLVELTATGPNYYEFNNVTGDEFALKTLELTPEGVKLRWLSWSGEKYRVWKCTDLASGQYSAIASNIDATPPVNEFVDPITTSTAIYRIELQQ